MNQFLKWKYQKTAEKMVNTLNNCGYSAFYASNIDAAKEILLSLIPLGSSVGMGGSETLGEMNLVDIFRNNTYDFFDRYAQTTFENDLEMRRKSLGADFFVSSVNAITKDGKLVNVDCAGNRIAAFAFGPKKVIVVAGVNKVVENLEQAFSRIREIAPMNALRNGHKELPCVHSGECEDCMRADSMCNHIGIVNHCLKFPGRITIIMVAEDVGF